MQEIQCYVCKTFGHLCCTEYVGSCSRVVSCYKCGQLGHTGSVKYLFHLNTILFNLMDMKIF